MGARYAETELQGSGEFGALLGAASGGTLLRY